MHLTRRHLFGLLAAAPAAALLPRVAMAQEPEIFAKDGVAINAIDPVGYFTNAAPTPGNAGVSMTWKGADWHFANEDERQKFMSNPEQYAPAFGGYCAYAASLGYVAPTIPEAWTVHKGKLYLNANLRARELWLQDIDGNIAKGEANWPGILG